MPVPKILELLEEFAHEHEPTTLITGCALSPSCAVPDQPQHRKLPLSLWR
jgi:hypothetical protein